MPDTRRHRGPHPDDPELFGGAWEERLRQAVRDLSWLLGRGYRTPSSIQLVGDRYALRARQREAVVRASCSDDARTQRSAARLVAAALAERPLWIDGFNVLLTVEAALGGGVVVRGRDGALRDMASVHGSYRRVEETERAVRLVVDALCALRPARVRWLLDRPVSNSGRLRAALVAATHAAERPHQVELVPSPDAVLVRSPHPVATSDSGILDRGVAWFDLAAWTIGRSAREAWVLDLG